MFFEKEEDLVKTKIEIKKEEEIKGGEITSANFVSDEDYQRYLDFKRYHPNLSKETFDRITRWRQGHQITLINRTRQR